jgi:hypothetical protein
MGLPRPTHIVAPIVTPAATSTSSAQASIPLIPVLTPTSTSSISHSLEQTNFKKDSSKETHEIHSSSVVMASSSQIAPSSVSIPIPIPVPVLSPWALLSAKKAAAEAATVVLETTNLSPNVSLPPSSSSSSSRSLPLATQGDVGIVSQQPSILIAEFPPLSSQGMMNITTQTSNISSLTTQTAFATPQSAISTINSNNTSSGIGSGSGSSSIPISSWAHRAQLAASIPQPASQLQTNMSQKSQKLNANAPEWTPSWASK